MYSRKPKQTDTFYRKLTQLYIQENQNKLLYFRENLHKYIFRKTKLIYLIEN